LFLIIVIEASIMDFYDLVVGVERRTQQRLPQYITELSALCAIDSFTYYKPGLDRVAAALGERMRDLGMDVTITEQGQWGNDLLGVLHGDGDGVVLLLGHMDTVYSVGTAEQRPVHIDGDKLLGPGVCDMKGCILAAIYALEALAAAHYRDFREIRFLCVSDEEITERHSDNLMRQASGDCQAAFVLEAARANGDIVSARKGNAWYTLSARGRAAHAGVEPEKGRNAIVEIAYQTLQFQNLNSWREGITINAGEISGGTQPNVVPDQAEVEFDLRFLHPQDRLATEEQWRRLMQNQRVPGVELTLTMQPDYKEPMMATPQSLALAERAREIAAMLGFSINHVLTGGASDGSYTAHYGVPTLDGLGPIGGLDHSPDEYLLLSSVAPRAALLAGLIAGK
jgi:glutamate carboxypeptidase